MADSVQEHPSANEQLSARQECRFNVDMASCVHDADSAQDMRQVRLCEV